MKSRQAGIAPIIIVLVVVVVLGVGGYLYLNSRGSVNIPGASTQQGGSAFDSIKDALSRSLTLECVYPDESGNEVKTYIKGGMVRVMGYAAEGQEGYGHSLMRDNKMYLWDDVKKEGIVMEFNPQEMQEAAEEMAEDLPDKPSSNQGKDYLEQVEKYKDYCKTASVSDAVFTVPTDVKFTDFGQQMEQMQEGIQQQMEDSGVDVEQMMEQYQQ